MERYLRVHGALDEEQLSKVAYDIYKGLVYLNEMGIVHRDLKVANVFRSE